MHKMAAKPLCDPLKKLEEQLSCSICLDQLTNPKTLSCLHSFCCNCLEKLTDYSNEVKCPTCRSTFDLGEEGVNSLQTSFLVNNLLEVHDMLKKVGNDKMVLCDVCSESFAVGYCQQCESFSCDQCIGFHNKWKKNATHTILTLDELTDSAYNIPRVKSEAVMKCTGHNKPLDIYCETCDELICQHCTVRIHRDHEYDVVNDIYDSQRETIVNNIEPIDDLINETNEQMESLNNKRVSLVKKGDKIKEEIQERVGIIMDRLFAAGNELSHKVDTAIEQQDMTIVNELEKMEATMSKLTSCKQYVEQCMSVGSPQQVLSSKSKLIKHTQSVVAGCDGGDYRGRDDFGIRLVKGKVLQKADILKSIGVVDCDQVIPMNLVMDLNKEEGDEEEGLVNEEEGDKKEGEVDEEEGLVNEEEGDKEEGEVDEEEGLVYKEVQLVDEEEGLVYTDPTDVNLVGLVEDSIEDSIEVEWRRRERRGN